jgi:acetyl-CoA C-acetyltransferase
MPDGIMFIKGVGRTKFGVLSESLAEMAYEVIIESLEDAKLLITDIDAIVVSNFLGGPLNSQLHINSLIASLLPGLNIPIFRVETACASSSAALKQALYSLQDYNNVMVLGVEKMTSESLLGQTESIQMAADRYLDQSQGLIFPANYALISQQYMMKYGIEHDLLEKISFINHKNANLNPLAHFYHKKVSMKMIENAPIIASPLNLFDCSPVSDGATSLIVSKHKNSDRDVEILSSQFFTDSISLTQRNNLTSFNAVKIASKKAYEESKILSKDVDLLEVHDCFTINEIIALEDLGFCESGKASKLIWDDEIQRDGFIPVNTDGGLKANGHPIGAAGLAMIYEIVTQIRGEAGKRQINNVEIGMTHNIGGIGGTAAVTILKGV